MKCLNKVLTIIGCITAAVAVVTAAFAVLNYFKEKKENAELEAYLEGQINKLEEARVGIKAGVKW